MRKRISLITTVLALLLVVPAAATAALVDEQRQGQNLVAQLQAGTKTCNNLSGADLDHIGEYVMFHALGSTSLHQAMNDRMTAMMGEQAETRVHQLLGARYAGCPTHQIGIGPGSMMGGGGMMGGYHHSGGWGAMMSSADWSWMRDGAWRNMTRGQWQQLTRQMMGPGISFSSGGWSAVAIVAVTLAGVAIVAALTLALARRRWRRQPPQASADSTPTS